MERINVRVDERLKHELEVEAREKGVKPSDIVRRRWRNTCGSGPPARPALISPAALASSASTKMHRTI